MREQARAGVADEAGAAGGGSDVEVFGQGLIEVGVGAGIALGGDPGVEAGRGTGRFSGATGTFTVRRLFDPAIGRTWGTIAGTITLGK
jgi:hypothetical protein